MDYMMMRIIAIFLILVSLLCLYLKYRVVIGGVLCTARVNNCEWASSSRGFNAYRFIMVFEYNGEYLEKPSISSTFSPDKSAGNILEIYYNEKHPKYVVNKGISIEVISASFIILGMLVFLI